MRVAVNAKDSWSIATCAPRAWFCSTAVINACGKKKPGSQKDTGGPFCSQPPMKLMRLAKSSIHAASGFCEGYAAFDQVAGTWLFSSEVIVASSEAVIATLPCTAARSCCIEVTRQSRSALYRCTSCSSTVPSEFVAPDANGLNGSRTCACRPCEVYRISERMC